MMCAIEAAGRGLSVLIFDHAKAPGEKIRISGGGRCNFTNLYSSPDQFLSENPHFCISALKRFTQYDFIERVDQSGIAWHEKTLGQLFCDGSSRQIVDLLVRDMKALGADLRLQASLDSVERTDAGFRITLSSGVLDCTSFVVATGGKSIPKMGATGLGYRIAEQFGMRIVETRPGLVPLTFDQDTLQHMTPLSGLSVEGAVSCNGTRFREAVLFTHRGLSGPAVLQISSYWREGDMLEVALAPQADVVGKLKDARARSGRQAPANVMSTFLPKRLARDAADRAELPENTAVCSDDALRRAEQAVNHWQIKPAGSEGYRTAEVTLGGVDTRDLDSRSMESRHVHGLYFIGEVVDVTGWLGGYNFQWAWSSGWAAGQAIKKPE